jgi:hypothetical protein
MTVILPNTIIKYFVDSENSDRNGLYVYERVTSSSDFFRYERAALLSRDDTFELDGTVPADFVFNGAGGADTYVIRDTLRDKNISIEGSATIGSVNTITLEQGVTVVSVDESGNDLEVRLSTGAVVTVVGHADFRFSNGDALIKAPSTAIAESAVAGSVVDEGSRFVDAGVSGVTYTVTDGGNYVEVDETTGQVTLVAPVDAEMLDDGEFTFTLNINDGTNPAVDQVVRVVVDDVNEFAPVVTESSIDIEARATTVVVTADDLSATDGDRTVTPASEIVYKVEALATGLNLVKDSTVLAVNGTFTQQDILNGDISLAITDGAESLTGLRLSLSDGENEGDAFDFAVRRPESVTNVDGVNTVELSDQAGSYTIETGDGNDVITAARGDDVIEAGLGDDIINLDGDTDSSTNAGRDQIVYSFGSGTVYSAADGGDTISGFKRGEDVFLLQTASESADLQTLDGFLRTASGTDSRYDDRMAVTIDWTSDTSGASPVYYVAGIALHFQDASLYSGGRLSSGVVKIGFAERITLDDFLALIEVTNDDESTDVNFDHGRGTIKDLTVLPTLLGEGSLRLEATTPVTLSFTEMTSIDEGESVAATSVATITLTNGEGYTLASNDDRFEIVGDQLMTVADDRSFIHEDGGTISVEVTASKDGAADVTETILVTVNNVDDAAVVFDSNAQTTATLSENPRAGVEVARVTASDADPGATVSYGVVASDGSGFEIDDNGRITYRGDSIDHDVDPPLQPIVLTVTATSSDGTRSAEHTITVMVTNVNDEVPVIERIGQQEVLNEGTFSSDTDTGYSFTASDDDGGTPTLSLSRDDDRFKLVDGVLQIVAGSAFDHEDSADSTIELTITAADTGEGSGDAPSATTTETVTINISNTNDNPPVITSNSGDPHSVTVAETAPVGTLIYPALGTFDLDDIVWSVSGVGANNAFAIDPSTGALTVAADLNVDVDNAQTSYTLTITATSGALTDTQEVTVTVTDENDTPPVIALDPHMADGLNVVINVDENIEAGVVVYDANGVSDLDADGQDIVWSLEETGDYLAFTIDDNDGEVRFRNSPNFEAGRGPTYNIRVKAAVGEQTATQNVEVNIKDVDESVHGFVSATELQIGDVLDPRGRGREGGLEDLYEITITNVDATGIISGTIAVEQVIEGSDDILLAGRAPGSSGFDITTQSRGNTQAVYRVFYSTFSDHDLDIPVGTYRITATISNGETSSDLVTLVTVTYDNHPIVFGSFPSAVLRVDSERVSDGEVTVVADANAIVATDFDGGPDTDIRYSIVSVSDINVTNSGFAIDPISGVITYTHTADTNSDSEPPSAGFGRYTLTIQARSPGTGGTGDSIGNRDLEVIIGDPLMITSEDSVMVAENTALDYRVAGTTGLDITWSLEPSPDRSFFNFNDETGAITFKEVPDFEGLQTSYVLMLRAEANGEVQRQTVRIEVTNVDEPTVITITPIEEAITDKDGGTRDDGGLKAVRIAVVTAHDPDLPNTTLTRTITSVVATNGGDETISAADFGFTAADSFYYAADKLLTAGTYTVTVQFFAPPPRGDDNIRTEPVLLATRDITFVVVEVSDPVAFTTPAPTDLFLAEDADGSGNIYTFTLSDDRFDVVDGRLIIKAGSTFTHEDGNQVQVTVTTSSTNNPDFKETFTLTVNNVNTEPVIFDSNAPITASLREGTTSAVEVARVTASDADLGASISEYAVTASDGITGFAIDGDGLITYTGAPLSAGTITLTVTATSSDTSTAEHAVTVTVNALTGTITEGTIAQAQDLTDLSVANGIYTFTLSDERFDVVDGRLIIKANSFFAREDGSEVEVIVTGSSADAPDFTETFTLTVNNVNDETVAFDENTIDSVSLSDNDDGRTTPVEVVTVTAADADPGATVTYALTTAVDEDGDDVDGFVIDRTSGVITYTDAPLSVGQITEITLTVTATSSDGGAPATHTVAVTLDEVRTGDLLLTDPGTITEGTVAAQDFATLPETPATSSTPAVPGLTLDPRYFNADGMELDSSSGAVKRISYAFFDFTFSDDRFEFDEVNKLRIKAGSFFTNEEDDGLVVTVTAHMFSTIATNVRGSGTTLTSTFVMDTFTLTVTDADNAAVAFASDASTASLRDDVDGREDAVNVVTVTASDADPGATVTYEVTSAAYVDGGDVNGFEFADNGRIIYTGAPLSVGEITLTVRATSSDDGATGATADHTVTVTVNEVVSLLEGTTNAADVVTVTADASLGAAVTYAVEAAYIGGTVTGFEIDGNGLITYTGDALSVGEITLTVTATSSDATIAPTTHTVVVTVNEAPTPSLSTDIGTITEGTIGQVHDLADLSGTFTSSDNRFEVIDGMLRIKAHSTFTNEEDDGLEVIVTASNTDFTDTFTLTVTNVDAAAVAFASDAPSRASLRDNANGTTNAVEVVTVTASDPDRGTTVDYAVTASDGITGFVIDDNGLITYIGNSLSAGEITLTVRATSSDGGAAAEHTVTVTVTEVVSRNSLSTNTETIAEGPVVVARDLAGLSMDDDNTPIFIAKVEADDPDPGATVTYTITAHEGNLEANRINLGNPVTGFHIDSNGRITYRGDGDAAEDDTDDTGLNPGTITLTVTAISSDDSPPVEQKFEVRITGDVFFPTASTTAKMFTDDISVTVVSVEARDPVETITYSISPPIEGFTIGATSGVITYTGDALSVSEITLTIVAATGEGDNRKTAQHDVIIEVNEPNNAPPVFNPLPSTVDIPENTPRTAKVLATFSASDSDADDVINDYSILSVQNIHGEAVAGFEINNQGALTYGGESRLAGRDHTLTFTVAATSSDGSSVVKEFDVPIEPTLQVGDRSFNIRQQTFFGSRSSSLIEGVDHSTSPLLIGEGLASFLGAGQGQLSVAYAIDEHGNHISGFRTVGGVGNGTFYRLEYAGDGTEIDPDVSETITVGITAVLTGANDQISATRVITFRYDQDDRGNFKIGNVYDAPSFTSDETVTISDGSIHEADEVIYTAVAREITEGSVIEYSLENSEMSPFEIDAAGAVTFKEATTVNFATTSTYDFTVIATVTNSNHQGETFSTEQDVRVHVSPFEIPATLVVGTRDDDADINGIITTRDQIIQGADGDDTINAGVGGGDKIIIGGKGDDIINLGNSKETIIYRFESIEGGFTTIDGDDTINDFDVGEDVLVLADSDATAVSGLSDFIATADDRPTVSVMVTTIGSATKITTVIFTFGTGNSERVVTVNFDQTGTELVDFVTDNFGEADANQHYTLRDDQYNLVDDFLGGAEHLLIIDDDFLPTDLIIL